MNPPPPLPDVLASLRRAGLRITQQRTRIVAAALAMPRPFTAETLIHRLGKSIEDISRATVYRTLQLLAELGHIRRLPLGLDAAYFEVPRDTSRNQHFVRCMECQELIPFDDFCLDLREASVARNLGFRLKDASVIIEAHCLDPDSPTTCARRRLSAETASARPSGKRKPQRFT